uniref:Uncharacterized protein n=1 Tax=Leptobrachium leishanense TaxID=445787 RepID=A0A8C5WJI4_9ANUR
MSGWRHCTLVLAAGRPSSYFLFLWYGFLLPPVLRRLCQLSLEIPEYSRVLSTPSI